MVMTLVFPDSLSNSSPRTAPLADQVFIPSNSSVSNLPTTWNPLSPISQDTTLAFAVPSSEASDFLASVQEISHRPDLQGEKGAYDGGATAWVVKAAKYGRHSTQASMGVVAANTWTSFVDLIKVCLYYQRCFFMLKAVERGVARHHHHGHWVLSYAFDVCFAFHVDETHGFELLARNFGPDFFSVCIPFRPRHDQPARGPY